MRAVRGGTRVRALLLTAVVGVTGAQVAAAGAERPVVAPGRELPPLLASAPEGVVLRAVATVQRGGAARAAADLRARGVQAQPLEHLPLVLVAGTPEQLTAAVHQGVVEDVHADERLTLLSDTTVRSMRADSVHRLGLTGRGVGIAVVDSGIDATHPDLADHVTHNVKMVPGTDLVPGGGVGTPLVVPVDQGPYSNSDTSAGHGTAVAGVAAADATTSPQQQGVAPDAHLIGYGAGDGLGLVSVLAAYDDILDKHEAWDIDVVNNSFLGGALPFDPTDPVHVATRAMHDAGLVVVFAGGNTAAEGSVNPYSVAPWVLSVGATDADRRRAAFSSGGPQFDNSQPVAVDAHRRVVGDGFGLYHPDVSAPGAAVRTTGTPTGLVENGTSPGTPGGAVTVSGTSFAAPHVAGLVALLLQARPSLTPRDVERILVGTAQPLPGAEPLWRSGFGFSDAVAAVRLARRPDAPAAAERAARDAVRRVQDARPFRVRVSDTFVYAPLPASVAGVDRRVLPVEVERGAEALHVLLRHPSDDGSGANDYLYDLVVRDPSGDVVGRTTSAADSGAVTVLLPLGGRGAGTYEVEVSARVGTTGDGRAVSDHVLLVVTQLEAQRPRGLNGPVFAQTGLLRGHLVPGPALPGATSPEGCSVTDLPRGGLDLASPGDLCQTHASAWAGAAGTSGPGLYTSAPLPAGAVLGGTGTLRLVAAAATAPTTAVVFAPVVDVRLVEVPARGPERTLLLHRSRPTELPLAPTAVDVPLPLTPTRVAPGSRLRLEVDVKSFTAVAARVLYGGRYDSVLELPVGTLR